MSASIQAFARFLKSSPRLVATLAAVPLLSTPMLAEVVAERTVSTTRFMWTTSVAVRTRSADVLQRTSFAIQRRFADYQARNVTVNRQRPRVDEPTVITTFSARPTTDELRAARLFPEPLLPLGGAPSDAENAALAGVLEQLTGGVSDFARLTAFLDAFPTSPWRASLLSNAAVVYASNGYFSRAATLWEQAWSLAKDASDPAGRAVADYAIGRWLQQAITFGQVERVRGRLAELQGRALSGPAAVHVSEAREGLNFLETQHDAATFSGPEAVKGLLTALGQATPDALARVSSTHKPSHHGTSLKEVARLADEQGVSVRLVHISRVGDIPVPSIVHLRSEHFTALVAKEAGQVLARDPAFAGERYFSEAAIRDETSGYFLVPDPVRLPAEARVVPDEEADRVIGRCLPGAPYDDPCGCRGGGAGMPRYQFHPVSASLMVLDNPLGYTPAVGPPVRLDLSYHQRDSRQPQTFNYGNVGAKWTWTWLSYVTDNNSVSAPPYTWYSVYLRGDGRESYRDGYMTHQRSSATLVKVTETPIRWERRLPDGSVEVFTLPDRAPTAPNRRIFLTELIDPQGHALTFTYDSSFRLVALTDALGQVTTLEYLDVADPLRLTKVTDPFGRSATMAYDASGRLASITDVQQMTSSFSYSTDDFIASMTTPYGTTTFRTHQTPYRRIEATDPTGGTERLEFRWSDDSLPVTVPSADVPTGFAAWNHDMHKHFSLSWDKLAMATSPGDVSAATMTHWLLATEPDGNHGFSRNVAHAVKRPLETRVWHQYPGQNSGTRWMGTGASPSKIARILDDGTTQLTQVTYNAQQQETSRTDPLGRTTTRTYATNGIDLLEVRQVNGASSDLLESYTGYSGVGLPASATDMAGETTSFTYNSDGKALTVTNALSETTTSTFDSLTGNLLTVTGAVSGAVMTYTYDGFGRVRSVSSPDAPAIVTDYDALDRVTKRTYPDGSYEELTYERLDLVQERDRLGRITRHFYNGAGRRTATRDPAGRIIQQVWCGCGSLEALIDGNGHRTTWERDVRGRVTREVRADGSTDTLYTYDTSGRLKTVTDPKEQVTTHVYAVDDSLLSTTYTNAVVSTPGVAFAYDLIYPRVTTMIDGTGTTSYTYKTAGQAGAGQVASVDGPLASDTMTYTYDDLARVTTRALNGSANPVTWAFDGLGRVTSEANVLGTFSYTYDGVSGRVAGVTYPNSQTSNYTYLPSIQEYRLTSIHHRHPSAATLSKFDYTYDVGGNILTWRQQADTTAVLWRYTYDGADQLTRAVKESTDVVPVTLQRLVYAYDPAANRTVEQIDDAITLSAYSSLNRLTARSPGGAMTFAGTVNEPATVTIQGKPAPVTVANEFRGPVPTAVGTTTATIVATDSSGNASTKQWEVDVAGSGTSFTYDTNGNLTLDGTRTFEWDARNQLVAVTVGTYRSEFSYDGAQRRVRIVEKNNGVVQSDTKIVWCNQQICEERAADGATVNSRTFTLGEQTAGLARFFSADHLGSIGEVTNSTNTLVARYAYDPWGRRSVTAGTDVTRQGFTGHKWQATGGLWLTQFRGYDSNLGRWLAEDPVGQVDGPNLYLYSLNRPVTVTDPLGLCACDDSCMSGEWKLHSGGATFGSFGLSMTFGLGLLSCVGKPSVYRLARVTCATWGLVFQVGVSGSIQWRGSQLSGPCNPQEIKPFHTTGWILSLNRWGASDTSVELGLGLGVAAGRVSCRVVPM